MVPETLFYIGRSVDEVFTAFNKTVNNVLLWSRRNQLIIIPVKTEAMLIGSLSFVGSVPPLYFGSDFIQIIESSTCLGIIWIINVRGLIIFFMLKRIL